MSVGPLRLPVLCQRGSGGPAAQVLRAVLHAAGINNETRITLVVSDGNGKSREFGMRGSFLAVGGEASARNAPRNVS